MKIEKITDNQLKITFDSIELEENNISVHSFLSHSLETQKMYLAILEIAYEDLGFDTKNSMLSYETISFGHYLFVTFITKTLNKDFSSNSLNVFKTHFKTNLLFPREFNYIDQTQYLFFSSINNFLDFYNLLHKTFTKIHFDYILYNYNSNLFLEILDDKSIPYSKQEIDFISSEIKSILSTSNLTFQRIKEFGKPLVKYHNI